MGELNEDIRRVHRSGGVEVMKASAGSGKTFSLAREYIRVLLKDNKENPDERNSHRHILAVTFTNKATEEMKARIVKELNQLAADPAGSDYYSYLLDECSFRGREELQAASKVALKELLNDYGSFSVSTIDKFFQRTLRAFSRELGQTSEYRVELDRSSLVEEAADRFWDSLSAESAAVSGNVLSSKDLLDWIVDCTLDKINNGEGIKIEESVREFAEGYLSASYDKKMKQLGIDEEKAFSEENIKRLKTICKKRLEEFDESFMQAVVKLRSVVDGLSFGTSLSSNFIKALNGLSAYGGKGQPLPKELNGATLRNAASDPLKVVTGAAKKTAGASELEQLQNAVEAVLFHAGHPAAVRKTCQLLLRQIVVFRVAANLRRDYDALLKEKNVFGIEDTNTILKDIIDGSDAPFIYEKTGTWFKHFLLDEFQDTSDVQWECFRPLLQNSISEGAYNLIVGDVKQSIYRWRDAEWNILGERVQSELAGNVENPLDTNWRSSRNVVDFNNAFYAFVAERLADQAESDGIRGSRTVDLYADVRQRVGGKYLAPGHVKAMFCPSGDIHGHIVEEVQDAHDRRHYAYKDIAVLVRKNSQGAEVAQALADAGIPIITNDSLTVGSSRVVGKTVSAMFLIDNPGDKVHTFEMTGSFDPACVATARSLGEMADALFKLQPAEDLNRESLYVLAFMDLLRDYVSNNGNSLHGFLNYWKETGMSKAISSPKDADAVTIITVHKSKGLDYQYVIIPFPRRELVMDTFYKNWYAPTDDEAFEGCERALYNVNLSQDSLFKESYDQEYVQAQIDFINTWYVAMTRAANEMTIIAPDGGSVAQSKLLSEFCESNLDRPVEPDSPFLVRKTEDSEDLLCYELGEAEDFARTKALEEARRAGRRDEAPVIGTLRLRYCPENEDSLQRGRIRISNEAADYFHGDGEDSARQKGIVLHGIMQEVNSPSELHAAVQAAVDCGKLRLEEQASTETLLRSAIYAQAARGWFDDDAEILSETEIIGAEDADNPDSQYISRPDRVVIKDDGVDIIDYKFGAAHPGYRRQVKRYMELYQAMGYQNVRGYLWFIADGRVDEVYAG